MEEIFSKLPIARGPTAASGLPGKTHVAAAAAVALTAFRFGERIETNGAARVFGMIFVAVVDRHLFEYLYPDCELREGQPSPQTLLSSRR